MEFEKFTAKASPSTESEFNLEGNANKGTMTKMIVFDFSVKNAKEMIQM